jgi:hypothetical protein
LIAGLILIAACGEPADAPFAPNVPTPTSSAGASHRAAPPTSKPGASAAAGRTAPPRATEVAAPKPVDGGIPGDNAPAFLRGSVPRLVVEVDAVQGRAPERGTVDIVRTRLEAVAEKPGGIDVLATETIPVHHDSWSLEDLRAAEDRYRDTHNSARVASLYLLFVDGTAPKEGAIGLTYSGSSAALFADQIEEASTLLISDSAIERAVTVHEVGHLLSLVNLGYTSSRDHEDPEHRGHSDNTDSVMFWAVDNIGVATLLGGRTEPPTEFDRDDLADLADVRAGRLP